ncbi:16S rRNA (uracil(1498)-N(3))-methyltransferase [Spongiivirga citrea]|uniref:Ribosomal RNA small subunit methyltransferase E n=1 Tax=Spongiivirga citrea TaxID=1481457 RepID=A0A6M0CES5_9FLAO|nr:16S rRNA (uracil(1498)-N(3))-methyltransferase [Spongiivirga citrea]NER15922.1 16S rRNA (uracil(1498)-N(3))-methyltransferase [Spongiivirga citrea]
MQLFYQADITATSKNFFIDKEESRHLVKVLRRKEGDTLNFTNGKGLLFEVTVVIADIRKCQLEVISFKKQSKKNYRLHIAVAPTKMNDRYEWFLEKATEIGIDEITPIICDHSERKVVKHERLQKILISAMKQSLQCHLPKLNEVINFSDFVKQSNTDELFIAHCEETDKISLKNEIVAGKDITILIGPEGDFSTSEIESALAANYTAVSLGETRLRTETAAIVACHTVALMNETNSSS